MKHSDRRRNSGSIGKTGALNIDELVFDFTLTVVSIVFFLLFPGGIPIARMHIVAVISCYALSAFILPLFLAGYYRRVHAQCGPAARRLTLAAIFITEAFLLVMYLTLHRIVPENMMSDTLAIVMTAVAAMGAIWGICIGLMGMAAGGEFARTKKRITRRNAGQRPGVFLPAVVIPLAIMLPVMIVFSIRLGKWCETISPPALAVLAHAGGYVLMIAVMIGVCIGLALVILRVLSLLAAVDAVRRAAAVFAAPMLIACALLFWYQFAPYLFEQLVRLTGPFARVLALIASGILPVRILMLLAPPIRPLNAVIGGISLAVSFILSVYPRW